ncbi:MAG: S-layer protein domain-containing protein [Euryarchaeota archaeon]|nr:S-layer protein domain-containing protein [Euryarchaeota archaeon]
MRHIHVVTMILCLCIVLLAIMMPASAMETDAMIHYSERVVNVGEDISLEQGYSLHVVDINSETGDLWVRTSLNNEELDDGEGTAKENEPFEYLITVEEEEDDEETDYLILRITPLDVVKKNGMTSSEIKIEQYLDPQIDTDDYLISGTSKSLEVGQPLSLEDGYTLSASEFEDNTVTLTLRKNGYVVKEEEEIGEGDIFSYTKITDQGEATIFIAKINSLFDGTDKQLVSLKDVSQRTDVVSESQTMIMVTNPEGGNVCTGEVAAVRYTIEHDVAVAEVLLDGKTIDERREVVAGTYSALTDKLPTGDHEVMVRTTSHSGTISTDTIQFSVGEDPASETTRDVASAVEDVIDGMNGSEGISDLAKTPGFGSPVALLLLCAAALIMRR